MHARHLYINLACKKECAMKKYNANLNVSVEVYAVLEKFQFKAQAAAQVAEELCIELVNAVKKRAEIPGVLKFMASCEFGIFVPPARAALNAAFPPAKKAGGKPAGKPAGLNSAEQAIVDMLLALAPERRKLVLEAVATASKKTKAA